MPTGTDIAAEVQALDRLGLEGLRAVWKSRYGRPPKVRSPELLRLSLAWRLQSEASGGLDAAARRRLRQGVALGQSDHVSPGVKITKQWHGELFEVERHEDGYRWKGETYNSLSAVAFAITGVKWNGPRFFGLRDEEVVGR